jgi:hypothetical protein
MRRWLYLALGLVLGAALGIFIGWVVWPVQYYDTVPAVLAPDYKDEYVLLVALSYSVDHDLDLAKRRLAALEEEESAARLVALTERLIERDMAPSVITPLAELASDLGEDTSVMDPYLGGSP